MLENGVCCSKDNNAIHARDLEQMTASTVEEITDEDSVALTEALFPKVLVAVSIPRTTACYENTGDMAIRNNIWIRKCSNVRGSVELF